MEEKKVKKEQEKNQKLSYEELSQKFADLYQNYQRLMAEYRKAMDSMNDKSFEYNAFFLNMLFKVIENPGRFHSNFVKWAGQNIEGALTTLGENLMKAAEMANGNPEKQESEGEEGKKEEAADEAK